MQAYQLANRVTTANAPLNGGKAYFYLTTTTTLEDVFEDAALATPLSNPVVANSAGFFPELVYLDPTKTYRLVLKTSAGATIFDADPINTAEGGTGIETADIADGAVTGDKLADGAIEDKLGYTPANDADVTTLETALSAETGALTWFLRSAAPTGYVVASGGTIGDASSGGTARANADTSALFALIWALDATNYPITDSAGGASTRGATAAADYALHKRLPLPNVNGSERFVRGWNSGGSFLLGETQADELKAHTHTYATARSDIGSGGQDVTSITGSGQTTGSTGGTETRPINIRLLGCFKL